MNKEQNNLLVNRILENIPKKTKPVSYLSNLLDISTESVYRRFRGSIPFTFEEISKLSQTLSFSVDDIIGVKMTNSKALFELKADELLGSSVAFITMLQQQLSYIKKLQESSRSEIISGMRHLTALSVLEFDTLFKFFYYKWTHQTEDVPINYFFSDVVFPSEIEHLLKEIRSLSGTTLYNNEMTVISNPSLCQSIVNEIQYYTKRGLINDEDLQQLKNELLAWVDDTESMIKTGFTKQGGRCNYFLSSFDTIESNSIYTSFDTQMESRFWIYTVKPLKVSKTGACKTHKEWFNSLKRYATYITQSNEMLQAEFLNQQRQYIQSIKS